MKKIVISLIIILFCWKIYMVYNYGNNPYWGKYESPESNTTLLLKRDNKCVLIGKE
ncbi:MULTISPECIES: hypothetical protein [Clostridium]|uniref:hypothetical protein n=1 Tax=Clostridium TaxID=1485 RepID=UPI000A80CDF4|nr:MULTISPECIES: hypothetical protein [Clostridium]MCD2345723.1 hypothetical protein [Clostridium guangxiense]